MYDIIQLLKKLNEGATVLKKVVTFFGMLLTMLLACPTGVWAAGEDTTAQVPVWLCIPFAGLLLCIAIMPLIKAEWWEAHQPHVVLMWIVLMIIPFAVVYGAGDAAETVLDCIINDYLTFIVLLFGLFCVSGNITMEGDFAGSPRVNVCLLAFGTLLSSCIGTTGASMLMVRPVIKMNSWRKKKKPYHGVLYLYGVQYGRLPDTDRRPAASDGIYARSTILLESASFPGTAL